MPKKGEEFVPFADGSVELARRDQVVRKSTSIQVQNVRGEEHNGVHTVQWNASNWLHVVQVCA